MRNRLQARKFSNHWKLFFQSLEKPRKFFPIIGKPAKIFSNRWKNRRRRGWEGRRVGTGGSARMECGRDVGGDAMEEGNRMKLGDICSFQSGGTPGKSHEEYFNGNIPWISTVALNGRTIDQNSAITWITEKAIKETAAKIVPSGSVMVGTRVGIGKVAVNSVPMSTSQDIISLVGIDNKKWSTSYLCRFIQAKAPFLQSQARGATIKGIKIDVLENLELLELPLEHQRKIA